MTPRVSAIVIPAYTDANYYKTFENMYENFGSHGNGEDNRQTDVWILHLSPANHVTLGKLNTVSLHFLIQKMAIEYLPQKFKT